MKTYKDRAAKASARINRILEESGLNLSFHAQAVGWFSKVFKKFINVKISPVLVDKKPDK